MFGSTRFKWLSGTYHHYGVLKTTGLAITAADADSATGVIKRGKMMDIKADDETLMVYGSGNAFGILLHNVALNGITDATGFRDFSIGKQDLPKKRGAAVTLRVPHQGSMAEFEGTGEATVDNLVCDATTAGFLATSTPVGTALSVLNGCWRIAQTGDNVIARLVRADLTPQNAGELRIRVQFVSPTVA